MQNRWDISAFEDDVDQVKQQHLDRNLQFLCNELNVMDKKEGLERVYFVSSREALAARLKETGTPTPSMFNFLPYNKILDESKLKVCAKDQLDVAKITIGLFDKIENTL